MLLKELLAPMHEGSLPADGGQRGINPSLGLLEISSISCDSRKAERNSLFVALKGSRYDGARFIDEAVGRGARVVILNPDVPLPQRKDVLFLRTADPRAYLRHLTQRFYGHFSSQVKSIGITGTNGKTTVTYLIESILKEAGKSCGVIGTVNYRIGDSIFPSTNTTPDFVENHRLLANLFKKQIEYCIMEVSSHSLVQGRVDLIDFKTAVFTNLSSDHLDYHGTRENYFLAKAGLFTHLLPVSTAVINVDDTCGCQLMPMTKARIVSYGINRQADLIARNIRISAQGTQFELSAPGGCQTSTDMGRGGIVQTRLVGRHNVYNILAAAAVGLNEGIGWEAIIRGIARLEHVPGRLERIDSPQGFSVFIDYAHTEDALKNALETMRSVCGRRVVLVFGCGGDRDKTKRPRMGAVASQRADVTILTNDNPRSEEPEAIVAEILQGFSGNNYEVHLDRKEAIRRAIDMARSGDVVLLAGKGHEDYQIFKDRTIRLDEREVVREYLRC
jgi:UDP-N-acetylmuramoyl-L-alanyl-D-glutamate--2,6-diaminopimelate ligase